MSTDASAGFFAEIGYGGPDEGAMEEGIPRDQWQRPLIVDPATGEMVPYTRASSMAGYIDNGFGLAKWQMALVAQGIGHRPDLAAVAASLPPYDELTKPQKKELYDVVDAALEVGKAWAKANHGTAVHAYTDPTHPSGPVHPSVEKDVRSHAEAVEMTGLRVFATEVFVVNDALKVAGTLDAVIGVPALEALLIGDTKTGKQDVHKTAIQIAAYAGGVVYDYRTCERTPLEEYVAALHPGLQLPPMRRDVGLYTHIPRGQGVTSMHPLNVVRGQQMLEICAAVREWKKEIPVAPDSVEHLTQQRRVPAITALTEASSVEELKAAYQRYEWCWDERLDRVGQTRFAELAPKKGA